MMQPGGRCRLVSFSSEVAQKQCPRCAREIPAGALECPQCRTLVHGDQMEQLAAHARSLEAHGDLQEAREKWLACLPLLPAQSVQAEWIRNHVHELDAGTSPQTGHSASGSTPNWVKKLGPLGPILLAEATKLSGGWSVAWPLFGSTTLAAMAVAGVLVLMLRMSRSAPATGA